MTVTICFAMVQLKELSIRVPSKICQDRSNAARKSLNFSSNLNLKSLAGSEGIADLPSLGRACKGEYDAWVTKELFHNFPISN
jgi:hypothetical protein